MSEAGTIIQKLGRNERPMCEDCAREMCAREMWLLSIKPAHLGLEHRTYECSRCGASKVLLVEPERKQAQSLGSE